MTEEEFLSRKKYLSKVNPQTADCPPEDEIAALKERFIDQLVEEEMSDLYEHPDKIQEYFMEANYDNTNLMIFFSWFTVFLNKATDTRIEQTLMSAALFLEEAVSNKFTEYVEEL